MGNDESKQSSEQRNSRNVSVDEVERALQRQRGQLEARMQEMLRKQAQEVKQAAAAAVAARSPPTQPSPAAFAGHSPRVAPPRPPPPTPSTNETINANYLERQRTPYSYNQNNLTEAARQTNSSHPLYPDLNHNANDFVFVNNNRFLPSAPPAPTTPRDRSVSRSRAKQGENDITCPTCKFRFGTRIFNCPRGHASCMECMQHKRACGLCGCSVTAMRNITMEEYVLERKIPCLNEDEGCSLHFKLGEMEQHIKECPFSEMQCLLPGGLCHWKGKPSRMAAHFDNFHPNHRGDVNTEMFIQMHNMFETKRMVLIKIGNFNFVFHLIVSEKDNKIYIAVQLLGTKISAAKWTYQVHIYNKGEPRRKYEYTDKCFSSGETVEDIMRENTCAVLPLKYAKTFINNGAVAYKFFITKEDGRRNDTDTDEPKRDHSTTRCNNWRARGRGRGRGLGRGQQQ